MPNTVVMPDTRHIVLHDSTGRITIEGTADEIAVQIRRLEVKARRLYLLQEWLELRRDVYSRQMKTARAAKEPDNYKLAQGRGEQAAETLDWLAEGSGNG